MGNGSDVKDIQMKQDGGGMFGFANGSWNDSAARFMWDMSNLVTPFDVPYITVIFTVLYALVALSCVVGNALVMIVILRHRKMRNVTNFLLANLALSDLCVGVFCVLPNLADFIYPTWVLGRMLCKLYYFIQCVSYTSSVLILTVISLERYFAIIYPILSKRLSRMCLMRAIIVVVWVSSAAYGVPNLVAYDTVVVPGFANPNITEVFCVKAMPIDMEIYAVLNFAFLYAIPLVVMVIMYTKISIVLWRTSTAFFGGAKKKSKKWFVRRAKHKEKPSSVGCGGGGCSSGGGSRPVSQAPEIELTAIDTETFQSSPCKSPLLVQTDNGTASKKFTLSVAAGTTGQPQTNRLLAVRNSIFQIRNSLKKDSGQEGSDVSPSESIETQTDIGDSDSAQPTQLPLANGEANKLDIPESVEYDKLSVSSAGGNFRIHSPANSSISLNTSTNSHHRDSSSAVTSGTKAARGDKRNRKQPNNPLAARRKVIRLLMSIIATFAVCVLPHHVRLLWQFCSPGVARQVEFHHLLVPPTTFLFFYLNSALNPLLYAFLSDHFRKACRELDWIPCGTSKRRQNMNLYLSRSTAQTVHSNA